MSHPWAMIRSMDYDVEGVTDGRVQGKHLFRVRESLVGGFYAASAGRHPAAVKLDLVLRGIALLPQHRGRRAEAGVVPLGGLPTWRLAPLIQPPSPDAGRPEDTVVAARREHVRRQLRMLEGARLLRVDSRPGRAPTLVVLSDTGDGSALDDPAGRNGDRYVTVPGAVIASGMLAGFDGARLVAFLAALVAEAHDPRNVDVDAGDGSWFRTPEWFATRYGRREQTFPFATSTLKRGLVALRQDGLVERTITRTDPMTGARLTSDRALYTNRFGTFAHARHQLSRATVEDVLHPRRRRG